MSICGMKKLRLADFQTASLLGLLLIGLEITVEADWHFRQSPVTNVVLNALTYGNGQFVAVGAAGTILTSLDGSNWISQTSGTTQTLWGVVVGANSFVAVGD